MQGFGRTSRINPRLHVPRGCAVSLGEGVTKILTYIHSIIRNSVGSRAHAGSYVRQLGNIWMPGVSYEITCAVEGRTNIKRCESGK